MLTDHAYGALADFRGALGGFLHGSILSKVGASGKARAVQNLRLGKSRLRAMMRYEFMV